MAVYIALGRPKVHSTHCAHMFAGYLMLLGIVYVLVDTSGIFCLCSLFAIYSLSHRACDSVVEI